MSLDRIIRSEARLIVLKALAAQVDGRLNSELLRQELETFGINRTRAWVHEEMNYLRDVGAVTLVDAGTVRVASLLPKGLDHVERRIAIEGVKRPSPPEV